MNMLVRAEENSFVKGLRVRNERIYIMHVTLQYVEKIK